MVVSAGGGFLLSTVGTCIMATRALPLTPRPCKSITKSIFYQDQGNQRGTVVIKDSESSFTGNSYNQEVFGQRGVIIWCLTRC